MKANQLRKKYLDFFASKGHTIIPSASLVPQNDPTTLFTGSGMQPMVVYLLGEKHPLGKRIVDCQKCFRTQDIEEIGDNRHTTVFEMLGNWSLGDYFKKQQIAWMFEFLTKEIGLDPKKIFITVFRGNDDLNIPRDSEAVSFWKEEFAKVGVEAEDIDFSEKNGMGNGRIFYYDEKKNWWSRAGIPANMPLGEPGGPDSEMFWDFGEELKIHENSSFKDLPCHVNCDCGRFVEIGNNVFMQYVKTKNGFELLPKGNIDFGGGLERILAASQNSSDIFLTDIFSLVIEKLEEISGKKYAESEEIKRSFRIIADHIKAATFLISDGVVPANNERGYFLRRLIRRAIKFGKLINIENNFISKIAEIIIQTYGEAYPNLAEKQESIFGELKMEEDKFRKTLEKGIREFEKVTNLIVQSDCEEEYMDVCGIKTKIVGKISAKIVFDLYTTYGFPFEMIKEIANEKGFTLDEEGFKEEMKKHQELSRTASAGMFKGGLADDGEQSAKLHTATHLLLAALRQVLGNNVFQKGSNITEERLRLDFSYGEKMTPAQILEVETLVNAAISSKLNVIKEEMTLEQAKAQNAMGVFGDKYGEKVIVYSIFDEHYQVISREICGGPHTKNTGNMGHFKIQKEEASSAGVRRIKAVLE